MLYADWIGPSFVHTKARLLTSVSTRTGALPLPTSVGHVPAPGPEVAIHLPITEDLPLLATSRLHATPCRVIAHPRGGILHSTIAHHHVIIGRKAHLLLRNWGKCFVVLLLIFFSFLPQSYSFDTPLLLLATYIPQSGSLNTMLLPTALKSLYFNFFYTFICVIWKARLMFFPLW